MKKLLDYRKVNSLLEYITVEKVYPLSIVEGYQSGEIFVDDTEKPTYALFWHYCGFAFIVGSYTDEILKEIHELMKRPTEGHSNRLVIQTNICNEMIVFTDLLCRERYIFSFVGSKIKPIAPEGCMLCPITGDNYELIQGNIVPGFSWSNKEVFLSRGFGFCLMNENEILACAFSASISNEYVDIGIETNEKYRGKGYGKIVASAMVEEIIKRGKEPAWACDTENKGSKRIACAVGFQIEGIHPCYKLQMN